jgi:hypothetical protein
MNIYLFYSPSNEEVVAICALNKEQAIEILNRINNIGTKYITDDYIYTGSFKAQVGAVGTVHTF